MTALAVRVARVPAETRLRIEDRLRQGGRRHDLAAEFSVAPAVVSAINTAGGVKLNRRRPTPAHWAKVVEIWPAMHKIAFRGTPPIYRRDASLVAESFDVVLDKCLGMAMSDHAGRLITGLYNFCPLALGTYWKTRDRTLEFWSYSLDDPFAGPRRPDNATTGGVIDNWHLLVPDAKAKEPWEAASDYDHLLKALRFLSPREAGVIHDHYFKSMTLDEIGAALGVSRSCVGINLQTALAKLRRRLAGGEGVAC